MIWLPLVALWSVFGSGVLQEVEYYPSRGEPAHSKKESSSLSSNKYRTYPSKEYIKTKSANEVTKREADPVFYGHKKSQEELWNMNFFGDSKVFDQTPSLIKLLHNITRRYFTDCIPVILYDSYVENAEGDVIRNLLKEFPFTFFQGRINDDDTITAPEMLVPQNDCLHFVVFLGDVKRCGKVVGLQATSKVVVVARSSQWAIQEFLQAEISRKFLNILVIGQTFKDDDDTLEAPYILYTHQMYIDGLGASKSVVLTSWNRDHYTRPEVELFPKKLTRGYSGHRFTVAAADQPPYVVRRIMTDSDGGNPRVVWDGIEVRILKLLGEKNNFSVEIVEPQEMSLGSGDAVSKDVSIGTSDIGIAGLYLTAERAKNMDMSFIHSDDCAIFISLTSTALPRYRAILGPFHWTVWLALTLTYLFAIFPLAFSDKHTLRHLIHNGGEVENMFWYVFGTFTNCFTFVGKNSWSKSNKVTTRLLIGWYWIFTIIITSCYTGSIIAFVTLPVFPTTIDSVKQLLNGFNRIGTLDHGGWERWFFNSSDADADKLLKRLEFVPSVAAGIRNTTKAFFWPYSFLGSKAQLEYIVQANFSASTSKRNVLHISNECFVRFGVSIAFPKQSPNTAKLSSDIARMLQTGLVKKIANEVKWELQRSPTGKLLAASSEKLRTVLTQEKGLTFEDTQGMFLLLGAGLLIGASVLLSEWMGGCTSKCRFREWRRPSTKGSTGSGRDLIPTRNDDEDDDDVFVIGEDTDTFGSRMDYRSYNSSAKSISTLEGQTISVTKEDIVVHASLDMHRPLTPERKWSRSTDLDKEISEIFEREKMEIRTKSAGSDVDTEIRRETASKGMFGDHI